MDLAKDPHRRYNLLTGEWVKVSPHRNLRPWQGQIDKLVTATKPAYDETCYLCPGNRRSNGDINPKYQDTFVFTNDFSALLPGSPLDKYEEGLLRAEGERGLCRVICFSPRHDLSIAQMTEEEVTRVTQMWKAQYIELGALPDINHVQIFENKGEIMGCSNPHPHGQIWAEYYIPDLPKREVDQQTDYFMKNNRPLLTDYLEQELSQKKRIIFETTHFVALVPFWAVWPFEAMILPRKPHKSLATMTDEELSDLAVATRRMAIRYDNLFEINFPYSMGLHQKPTNQNAYDGFVFHIHYYPPLLRSATIKKFMVGYEMLAMAQRDITAEQAAERLRGLSNNRFA